MTIHDWIKTTTLYEPNHLGEDAKSGLASAGLELNQVHQSGGWWNNDRLCQEAYIWDKESDRVFRLWRGSPQERWKFGEEVIHPKSA